MLAQARILEELCDVVVKLSVVVLATIDDDMSTAVELCLYQLTVVFEPLAHTPCALVHGTRKCDP